MFKTRPVRLPFVFLMRLSRKLWVRVALMAALALVSALATTLFEDLLPIGLRNRFAPDAALPVLTILASGMLAVSTFSLNVMVAAFRAAADQATPRAHRILLNDTTTQSVLAVFIGAFVYSLSAILLLKAGLHGNGSVVILMGVTALIVVLVIVAMVRWIDHLSDLGSLDATLRLIEAETRAGLIQTRACPGLAARVLSSDTVIPANAEALRAPKSGYLQVIDLAKITGCLPGPAAHLYLTVAPGTFVLEGQRIGHVTGLDASALKTVQAALVIGEERTFEQDATFGLLILSETGSRALSPGINDPGTAIDVIARLERLLWHWGRTAPKDIPFQHPQIYLPRLDPGSLIENAFSGVARDGAGQIEVVKRLLGALTALQQSPDSELSAAAEDMADLARAYAARALPLEREKAQISA